MKIVATEDSCAAPQVAQASACVVSYTRGELALPG